MDHVKRSDIPEKCSKDGHIQMVFGPEGYIRAEDVEMAYCRFQSSAAASIHACASREMLYIGDAKNINLLANTEEKMPLKAGDVLLFSVGETYQFLFDAEDGYADAVLFSPLK